MIADFAFGNRLIETQIHSLEERTIKMLDSFGFATKLIKNGWYQQIFPKQRPTEPNRWLWTSDWAGS